MFIDTTGKGNWSARALTGLFATAALFIVLSVAHALLEMKLHPIIESNDTANVLIWLDNDIRTLCEQLVYVFAIIFVGAKFFETRTTFGVSFDRIDTAKMRLKGPDEENIVWIGHKYGNRAEAEAVAAIFENRLQESAA
jgi:hypothetical protein